MREPRMKDVNDTWYAITNWDGQVTDTIDREEAKIALREGREVFKHTRRVFEIGETFVRLAVTVEIKKAKNL